MIQLSKVPRMSWFARKKFEMDVVERDDDDMRVEKPVNIVKVDLEESKVADKSVHVHV